MAANSRIIVQSMYDVTIARVNDSSIIDPQHIEELRATLFDLIDKQNRTKLILDITRVRHLSSAALAVLIPLQEKYKKAKGQLVLVGVCEGIMKLFTITKLNKLLSFAATEDAAMSQLGATQKK